MGNGRAIYPKTSAATSFAAEVVIAKGVSPGEALVMIDTTRRGHELLSRAMSLQAEEGATFDGGARAVNRVEKADGTPASGTTRRAIYERMTAEARQAFPGLDEPRRMSTFFETERGRSMYAAYKAAVPDVLDRGPLSG